MHGNRSHLWRVPMQNDAGVVDMGQRTVDDFRAKFIDQNLYRRAYRGMCSSRFWKGGGGRRKRDVDRFSRRQFGSCAVTELRNARHPCRQCREQR